MRLKPFVVMAVTAVVMLAQSGDEAGVREAVQKYVNARDLADPAAIEALFTPDADQLVSTGEWRKGRAALVKGTTAASKNEGKRTITVESVRFVTPEVALAEGRYEVASLTGGEPRKMWTSLVLKREGTVWRIAAIRNMLPSK